MTNTDRGYTIQALHHALEVLETFLEPDSAAQGVSEISETLELNKSRVFRILNTLEQHRFIEQDPKTKQYRLGLCMMAFGDAVRRRLHIVQVAAPILDELAEQSGETVHMTMLDGHEAICVARRESKHPVRLYAAIGRRAPLHVGGTPKVLLAYMSAEEQAKVIYEHPLQRFTEKTITDPEQLKAILAQIRRDGYTVATDDLDWATHSIAAPIRNHTGRVIASISIAGPSQRFSEEKIEFSIRVVCDAALQISSRLGYDPQSPRME